MTVASAWVIGRVTDRVIVPAFEQGRTTTGALLGSPALAIVGVAVLKAAGIVARRLGRRRHAVPAAGAATGAR